MGEQLLYRPQSGDIGLTQIRGRVGIGIHIAQGIASGFRPGSFANYQHAFVCVGGIRTEMDIIEAEPGGAELNPLARYDSYDVKYLRCPEEFRFGVAEAAMQLEGVGYSFLDYGSLFLAHIGIKADWLENYIKDSGHMICSQLADHAALQGGWHLFNDGRWEGDVMPIDLSMIQKNWEGQVYPSRGRS
jgi:hypothetical protein